MGNGGNFMVTQKAGVILIHPVIHKIGLVYREKQKDYSFPKGHLEANETLPECAVRETAEETKRDCRLISDKEIGIIRYNSPTEVCEVYMYLAEDTGDSDNASPEVHELKWVDWGNVEKLLTYQNLKDFWNEVKDSVKKYLNLNG